MSTRLDKKFVRIFALVLLSNTYINNFQNKDMIDTDQQDLGYDREQTGTPKEDENRASHDGNQVIRNNRKKQ